MAVCATAILGGLVVASVGFLGFGGAIGYALGGAGLGAAVVGLRSAIIGETPRLY